MARSRSEKFRIVANSARPNDGVVNRAQLTGAGLSKSAISRRTASGRLVREHPRTFVHPASPRTWQQRANAALAWLGNECYLHAGSACRVWRIRGYEHHQAIELTGTKNIRRRRAVRYRRTTRLPDGHFTEIEGLRVTTPARTIFDVASDLGPSRLGCVIDEFLRRGLVSLEDISDVMLVMGTKGRKGMTMLRRLLADRMGEGGPSHNKTEIRLYKILRLAGLRPIRQFRVDWSSGAFYIDCAWPSVLVGAESDSFEWHGTRSAWDRDKDRERILKKLGWRIVRFTWEDIWFRPDFVVDEVRKELAAAEMLQGGAQEAR